MVEILPYESRDAQISKDIESEVARIGDLTPIVLPEAGSDLVQSYIRKIEGTYNVERAKRDTDSAIDLLYIAYNTTPQEISDVRIKIENLMNKLIRSQQDSQKVMEQAMTVADRTVRAMRKLLPAWLDAKGSGDPSEIKSFFGSDVVETAREIRTRALKIRDDLLRIAGAYDDIIKDTVTATSSSEKALGDKLTEKAAIEKEINEANAKREQLEALVGDLKEEVAKFDKMAKDYEARASTAEQRAFVMSIVRVGAQMISQAVPAIAMAAGGPAPMLASSALSVLNGPAPSRPSADASEGSRSAEAVQTKTRISEQRAELKKADEKAAALKADIRGLEAEKAKLTKAGDADTPAATGTAATQTAEFDKRIRARTDELKSQEDARARIEEAVNALQASLGAADKGLAKMSDEQQQQATSLRDMQMRMLDKVETYEKERRNQSAELVKINALLKGQRSTDDKIHLAVKSLNLSVSALKRTKEIVVEIAFFFKSFADFMDAIALEASDEAEDMESAAKKSKIGSLQFGSLVESVDRFFITQTAEWLAVKAVADKFNMSFADGWSKLNKLSGTYIVDDQLKAYLETASAKLAAIAAEREAASDQKIASLGAYRARMRESA